MLGLLDVLTQGQSALIPDLMSPGDLIIIHHQEREGSTRLKWCLKQNAAKEEELR
jgi:hypothetical protein